MSHYLTDRNRWYTSLIRRLRRWSNSVLIGNAIADITICITDNNDFSIVKLVIFTLDSSVRLLADHGEPSTGPNRAEALSLMTLLSCETDRA